MVKDSVALVPIVSFTSALLASSNIFTSSPKDLLVNVCVATVLTSSPLPPAGSVRVFVTPALCGCACIVWAWAFDTSQ